MRALISPSVLELIGFSKMQRVFGIEQKPTGARMMRGLGFLVSDTYAGISRLCRDKELNISKNVLWLRVQLHHNRDQCVFNATVYLLLHDLDDKGIERLFKDFSKMIVWIRVNHPNVGIVLGGDFNAHLGELLSEFGSCRQPNPGGLFLLAWVPNLGMTFHNARTPELNITRTNYVNNEISSEGIIYYFISSGIAGYEAFAINMTGLSDHNLLICDFKLAGKRFASTAAKRTTRVKLDFLCRHNKQDMACKKKYYKALDELHTYDAVKHELADISTYMGNPVDIITRAAKIIDSNVMKMGRKILGVRVIHNKFMKLGFDRKVVKLRLQRSNTSDRIARNKIRHRI